MSYCLKTAIVRFIFELWKRIIFCTNYFAYERVHEQILLNEQFMKMPFLWEVFLGGNKRFIKSIKQIATETAANHIIRTHFTQSKTKPNQTILIGCCSITNPIVSFSFLSYSYRTLEWFEYGVNYRSIYLTTTLALDIA